MKKEEIIKLRYEKFLLKYESLYNERMINYIKEHFWDSMDEVVPDVLMQLYSEFGILKNNFYLEHLNKLKQRFDITGNILDVGSGVIPAFGNLVAKEQLRIGSGTITLYDPKLILVKPKYPNMKLVKKEFTLDTDVSNFDLITGILPCGATEDIIESACKNNKNFYLAMCGCTHFKAFPLFTPLTAETYQDHVIGLTNNLLKKYNNGELVIEKLDDSHELNYPILYNKK